MIILKIKFYIKKMYLQNTIQRNRLNVDLCKTYRDFNQVGKMKVKPKYKTRTICQS